MKEMNKRKRGIKLSEEHKRKISQSLLGKIHSEKTKIKMSKSQKGKKKSKLHRLNLSEAMLGKQMSQETKNKMKEKENGAKIYLITRPNGETEIIKNLTKYCKDNGLSRGHMTETMSDNAKFHKGYKCIGIGKNQ